MMRSQDEGVKLREEKNYQDFYPDLEANRVLTVSKGDDEGEDATNHEKIKDLLLSWKQIITNESLTIERLGPQIKKAEYRHCKFTVPQLNSDGKVGKQYCKYGYKSQGSGGVDFSDTTYVKKTDLVLKKRNDFFGRISSYQVNFQVEYDMDEQDELFLRYLNEIRLNGQRRILNHEIFEIIITVLENEAFHLENKIPPRVSLANNSNTHESHAAWKHHDLYGSDDGTGYPNDQPCAVCGGTECDNSNAIVFCDGCDIAVHQECYGVVFIPEGQWLCRRCMISKNRKIDCLFCPSLTGAFKQTDNGCWGHVVCGIWIPELHFGNIHYMEPISGIEYIPKSRWKLGCYICKQEKGACIQCSNRNCFAAYHTTCAKRAGLYMNFNGCSVLDAASKNFPSGSCLESFCHKHSPNGWPSCEEGIKKTRDYFDHLNKSKITASQADRDPKTLQQNIKNKWKTSRGTLIAPQSFATVVEKVLKHFQISSSDKISIDLCKYWTMKRELKRGAPLVRKFDPSSLNYLSTDEINERDVFSQLLLDDLSSLESLAESFVSKHECAVERKHNQKLINSIAFHPVKYLIEKSVWNKLKKSQYFKILCEYERSPDNSVAFLDQIQNALSDDNYSSIQQFEDDFTDKILQLIKKETIPRTISSSCTNLLQIFDKLVSPIRNLDVSSLLSDDFDINQDSRIVEEIPWKGPKLLKREKLEDVTDLTIREERLLKGFLRE